MLSEKPFQVPPYLIEKSRGLPPIRMAVAGADHKLALESARASTDAGLIDPVLVGDTTAIKNIAKNINWDISSHQIVDASDEIAAAQNAVSLARHDEVASIMKGHVHTDQLMKAVVDREGGLRTDRRISHVFHMTIPDQNRVLYITDAAINIAPNPDTKIDIIKNAVDVAHAMGQDNPHVALLSATESVLEAMPSSVRAAEVVKRATGDGITAGEVTGAVIDGPFAFDNAVSMEAALLKGVDSPVAGQADILVVPNIEMGNGLFKMMVYFMSGLAAGIVMGAKVPIVLTSRADPPEARFAATAIAAILAND